VSVTGPGQFLNTTMAEVTKVWQDYLDEPLTSSPVTDDDDELLASAVNKLIESLSSFGYDDILLRTQVGDFI